MVCLGKVDDHRVLSNRSKAFVAIGNYAEALKDAERCCILRPFWPKVCTYMHYITLIIQILICVTVKILNTN